MTLPRFALRNLSRHARRSVLLMIALKFARGHRMSRERGIPRSPS